MGLRRMRPLDSSIGISGYGGHAHFWERLTRRQFLTTAAGTFGLVLASESWLPKLGGAATAPTTVLPQPIPGGITGAEFAAFLGLTLTDAAKNELFHTFAPLAAPGNDPSTITDFHGFVGAAEIQGTAKKVGSSATFYFDNDMRFMQGEYIGVDGQLHNGTIGFF